MNLLDFVKALGVACAIMVLNVAASFPVMWVYGTFIDTGREDAYYAAAAERIAPWSSLFVGAPLFFLAMLWLAWRRQGRNGYLFAGVVFAIYAAIDVAVITAYGALAVIGALFAVSMGSKLAAAELGAWMSRPR